MPDPKITREKEYYNQALREGTRKDLDRYYCIFRQIFHDADSRITDEIAGKKVLEYGCGTGSHAYKAAAKGGIVTGIDISEVAIELSRNKAKQLNLTGMEFMIMDAENTKFEDNTFDVICGSGIIHHLDLNKSYKEISRTLKKNGTSFFLEPLGHNPVINLYRRFTPKLRTADEHPLRIRDIMLAKKYFRKVDVAYYYLFALLAIPLKNTLVFEPILRVLTLLDKFLFAVIPFTRRYAWYTLIEFSEPIK